MTSTNGYSIEFDDGAYILVPSNANISNLTKIVTYADNAAYSGKSGGFACISFYYKNLPLGNSTIYIKDNKNSSVTPGTNGVMTEETHITINKDKTIYINIFVLIGAVAGLSLIVVPVVIRVKTGDVTEEVFTSEHPVSGAVFPLNVLPFCALFCGPASG